MSRAECDAIDQTRSEQMQLSCTFREENFIHEAAAAVFAREEARNLESRQHSSASSIKDLIRVD